MIDAQREGKSKHPLVYVFWIVVALAIVVAVFGTVLTLF